jgi:hypothetical protein
MSADVVFLSKCEVRDEAITVRGDFADSANKYRGYKLRYNDGILYIQIRGSLLSLRDSGGEFDIALPNRYDGLREIYIQGAGASSDRLLAWPRAS